MSPTVEFDTTNVETLTNRYGIVLITDDAVGPELQERTFPSETDAADFIRAAQVTMVMIYGEHTIHFPVFVRDLETGEDTEVPW